MTNTLGISRFILEILSQIISFIPTLDKLWKLRQISKPFLSVCQDRIRSLIFESELFVTFGVFRISPGRLFSSEMHDFKLMRLECDLVDSYNKVITLIPNGIGTATLIVDPVADIIPEDDDITIPDSPTSTTITLTIPQELDRLSYSIKCLISHPNGQSQDFCTLLASDTPLDNTVTTTTISTFEMVMTCTLQRIQGGVRIGIVDLKVSYSFYFSRIYGSLNFIETVHDKKKVKYLVDMAKDSGLFWRDKYFCFDVVIHYLLIGDGDDVIGVIEFLKEYEVQHQGKVYPGTLKTRYYRAEGK